ncbi:MAG: hypothetical protein ACD_20C00214G0023 [uncultured bacterium]|nr:MAG: hypothetical protein ACD_20C00214G0023 [uncultured bacterium]HBH19166.1 hypothetical protein [Cyanobacteria bacterium UBA9579]
MKFKYQFSLLIPVLLYPIGDAIAQLILQEFNIYRFIALTLAALLIYQWEIPIFFKLIENAKLSENKFTSLPAFKVFLNQDMRFNWIGKTIAVTLFFNPFWISRHMLIIELGTTHWASINFFEFSITSLELGYKLFLVTLPIVFIGNFIVQNKISHKNRFLGNAVLSGLLAIFYAVGYRFF